MNRKKFIASAAALGSAGAFFPQKVAFGKAISRIQDSGSGLIEKVKTGMLATQRRSWEQGTAMQALIEIDDTNTLVLLAHEAMLRNHPDGRLGMVASDNNVTDPISNGIGVKHAYNITGNEQFKMAAERLLEYAMKKAPRLENGALSHIVGKKQAWSDSMFMAPPFLAIMGEYIEAINQIEAYREYLWNEKEQLFHHIWSENKNEFINKAFWGGGNGWCAAGIALVIDMLPANMDKEKNTLVKYYIDLLSGCLSHVRPDGLFYNNINDPNSFVETNLSQMLAYSIFKGYNSGWLPSVFLKEAQKMRETVHTKIDSYGRILDACGSPNFDSPGTSTEAQAFFLMMEAQAKKPEL